MPAEQVTIAEMMKAAGYATGHVGKWHVGYQADMLPNAQGFDTSFGHMGGCIDNYSHFFYWQGPNRHDLWRNGKEVWADGQFFPDLMVKEADAFITSHARQPWFLYWAINVPHYPLQGTERWRDHYKDLPAPRRMYAAFVSTMDQMIGQVMSRLDELGLAENTIVIFQSDHGHSTEVRTFGGGGSAGPYRGAKFSLFEGGIRVPAMISWPGKLPEGEVRDQLSTGCDWLPTIAQLCDAKLPQRTLDGASLVPVIRSATAASPHPRFYWQSLTGANGQPQWAVRDGDWKLIANPRQTDSERPITAADDRFLVNLADDPGEQRNVAAQHPERVKQLEALHNDWLRDAYKQ